MANLYIVATPIGNLDDVTLRAINILQGVDLVLAEDTRVTQKLFQRYNIKTPTISYHQHSSLKKVDEIIKRLEEGKNLALVSDAGTPGINDPGGMLIKQIVAALPEVNIVPIPGPNAALSALSISGFPTDKFVYLGFPPHKKGRQKFFKGLGQIEDTVVFYESKHRIIKSLEELKSIAQVGDRPVMVARELTKQFETVYRGIVDDILPQVQKHILGEFVVVVGPK